MSSISVDFQSLNHQPTFIDTWNDTADRCVTTTSRWSTMAHRSLLAGVDFVSAVRHLINIATPISPEINSNQDDLLLRVQRISLASANLALHFDVSAAVVYVLQLATEFGYTIFELLRKLLHLSAAIPSYSSQLIQSMWSALSSFVPNREVVSNSPDGETSQGEIPDHVNPSINPMTLISTLGEPETIASITAIVGGLIVLVASAITGVTNWRPHTNFLSNLSTLGRNFSGINSGMNALISLVSNFHGYVYDAILRCFGRSVPHSVMSAVEAVKVSKAPYEEGHITPKEFCELLVALDSDDGEDAMAKSTTLLEKGKSVLTVIRKITTGDLKKAFNIPPPAVNHLLQKQRSLEKRVSSALAKALSKPARFTPFCVWLAGDPGIGKSVAMNRMSPLLMKMLKDIDEERYEVPQEELWTYACTFTNKYFTGYQGQYVVKFDDMCQDKPGSSTENNSSLLFITWKSCVPVNVNQAAIADKKCSFTSKVLLCSSNEMYPARDAEILHNDALQRRRDMLIKCEKSDVNDPTLNWPIKFSLWSSISTNQRVPVLLRDYRNFDELMKDVGARYMRHFANEERILNGYHDDSLDVTARRLVEEMREIGELADTVDGDVPVAGAEAIQPSILENSTSTDEESTTSSEVFQDLYTLAAYQEEMYFYARTNWDYFVIPEVHDVAVASEDQSLTCGLQQALAWEQDEIFYRYLDHAGIYVACDRDLSQYTISRQAALEHCERNPVPENWLIQYSEHYSGKQPLVVEPSMFMLHRPTLKDATARILEVSEETTGEFLARCYEAALELSDYLHRILSHNWWKLIGAAAAIFSGLALAYYKLKSTRIAPTYDKNVIRTKPKPVVHPTPITANQPVVKPSINNFGSKLLDKNMVKVESEKGGMNGMFVCGRVLLTCLHFFATMKLGDEFKVRYGDVTWKQVYDPKKMRPVGPDSALYECDFLVPQFRDVIKHFTKDGQSMPERFYATLATLYPSREFYTTQFKCDTQPITFGMPNGHISVVRKYIAYGVGSYGMSGSPLLVHEDVNRAPQILGLQFGLLDRTQACYVEPITQEQLISAIEVLAPSILLVSDVKEITRQDENFADFWKQVEGTVTWAGNATRRLHMSSKTSLRPSDIASEFEIDTSLKQYLPAALSGKSPGVLPENQNKDPLLLSMAGFGHSYGGFDCRRGEHVLRAFCEEDMMIRQSPPIKYRLLDEHEILNGIPGILKGVELSTSPGLPYVHERKKSGKLDFIDMDNDVRHASERVWNDVAALEECAAQGRLDENLLAYACLKDELRPVQRVENLKTRTFIVLPMHYNLLLRKYFGVWIAIQHKLVGKISSCVGIDATSNWHLLYEKLLSVGQEMEDFDYTEWDRTLHAGFFNLYARRVSAAYGDEPGSRGYKVRLTLMEQLVHMRIQVQDFIILVHGGNKSGCAITAEINSDIHDMLMYYAWLRICEERKLYDMMTISSFRDNVALIVYGDDLVKSTAPGVIEFFNGNEIQKVVESLGMAITPASKTDTEFRVKTIEEVTFLKRSFLRFPEDCGLVRAPLEKSVLQRMVLWVHKSDDPTAATKANVENAVKEAFYWGERYYEAFRTKCLTAWVARHSGSDNLLSLPEYEVVYRDFVDRSFKYAPVYFSIVQRSVDGPGF